MYKKGLAFRVILLGIILLVLPLLAHSLFLYEKSYEDRKRDLYASLKMLAEEKSSEIISFLHLEQSHLDEAFKKGTLPPEIKAIYYFQKNREGHFVCIDSSKKEMIGRIFTSLGKVKSSCSDCVWVEKRTKEGIYLARVLIDLRINNTFYPVIASLMRGSELFSSSDKNILKIAFLLRQNEDGYYIERGGRKSLAILYPCGKWQLLLEVEENHIRALRKKDFIESAINFSLFALIASLLAGFFTYKMVKPIHDLKDVMNKVSGGDETARYCKKRWGFEINEVGHFFNDMMDSFVRNQKAMEREKIEKEKLAHEIHIGQDIQKSLLPTSLPKHPRLDIAAGFLPAKEIGGDFYDLFLKDDKLVIVMADTSGKGISACLYSLGVRSIIRSSIYFFDSLEKAISVSNDLFCMDTKQTGMFTTVWIGIYDEKTQELQYHSAGHPLSILKKRDGEEIDLSTEGIALGVEKIDKPEVKLVKIETGDRLIVYTDGITEAENEEGAFFGKERLLEFLQKAKHASSKSEIFALLEEIKGFTKTAHQSDDITALLIRAV